MSRHVLVTTALPYANGPLHLGHLLEGIQADIWVRFQHLFRDQRVCFLCASDAHGTPIMLAARGQSCDPAELAEAFQKEHHATYQKFGISHDHYFTTDSDINRTLAEAFYKSARSLGLITRKNLTQAYDEQEQMFLSDRMIQGTCPKCAAPNQYGDACESCGATYKPADLIDPVSTLSQATPTQRESEHLFFDLPQLQEEIRAWLDQATARGGLQKAVRNKLEEWLRDGLKPWDISREAPYFGFEIPGEPDKYFYVWLDAPIGYMACLHDLCSRNPAYEAPEKWWPRFDASHEADSPLIYHFIGKDIINFHALFWPALLQTAGYALPDAVFAHGFLTVNGEKMSKSLGTFILAEDYIKAGLPVDALRYYLASRLGPGIEDLDFDLQAFVQKYNSDILGKVINLAARAAPFLHREHQGALSPMSKTLMTELAGKQQAVMQAYEGRNFAEAIRLLMETADEANKRFADAAPWKAKQIDDALWQLCSDSMRVFLWLAHHLSPVLPDLALRTALWIQGTEEVSQEAISRLHSNRADPVWHSLRPFFETDSSDLSVPPYRHLAKRIKAVQTDQLVPQLSQSAPTQKQEKTKMPITSAKSDDSPEQTQAHVSVDDFGQLDLRVGLIKNAESVDGADRLIRLQIDVGETQERTIFSAIRQSHEPAQLVGQRVVVLANLKPRKMRFGISEGMILAGENGADVALIGPENPLPPGSKVC